jgi:DNA-binding MarR family transcriptional regulator
MKTKAAFNDYFKKLSEDYRISAAHISLFAALYVTWSRHQFAERFRVLRADIMKLSKIDSRSSYHKHLRDLIEYGYIEYEPCYEPGRGSEVKVVE